MWLDGDMEVNPMAQESRIPAVGDGAENGVARGTQTNPHGGTALKTYSVITISPRLCEYSRRTAMPRPSQHPKRIVI
jgi:hypothetical protein